MLAILAAAAAMTAAQQESPKAFVVTRSAPQACGYWKLQPTDDKARLKAQELGKLPSADMEYTVLQTDEEGCSKAVTVRKNVSGDGRSAPSR